MDLPGAGLIMAAVVCYVLALEEAGVGKAWNSSMVIGLLVGFVLIVITFCVVEYYQNDRALLVPRLMKNRTMIVCCAFVALYVTLSKLCVFTDLTLSRLGGSFFVLLYYLRNYPPFNLKILN